MAAPSAEVAHLRASLARRTQSYPPNHQKVVEAKQQLVVAGLVEHVKKVVSDWPTPTPEQLEPVAALLRAGMASAALEPAPPPAETGGTTSPSKTRETVVQQRIAELDGGDGGA